MERQVERQLEACEDGPTFQKHARHALTLGVRERHSHLTSLITTYEIAMRARRMPSVRRFEAPYARFQRYSGALVRA
jgi:hypothetical protein